MSTGGPAAIRRFPKRRLGTEGVLYPEAYLWFVFMSALDVIMTWCVLYVGGEELNHLANSVILAWELPGLLAYKFSLVTLVIVLCEVIGRQRPPVGRRVAWLAVTVTAVPVLLAIVQLLLLAWLYWPSP